MWSWLKQAFGRRTQSLVVGNVTFLCEQDGIPERALKSAIAAKLHSFEVVHKAYLARVDYGDSSRDNVALCLSAPENRQIADVVGKLFHDEWRSDQFLDIIFLTPDQESLLAKVCQPFYVASRNAAD